MADPVIFRKFIRADLTDNANREWSVKYWADGTLERHWGRVGTKGMTKVQKGIDQATVDKLIANQVREGYKELDLHAPTVTVAPAKQLVANTGEPKVDALVSVIYAEAGETIKSYLSTTVDALSKQQLDKGRDLLEEISRFVNNPKPSISSPVKVMQAVEAFYNTIPTKLPPRIDKGALVKTFLADLSEQETRLDQLEAALATYQAQVSGATQTVALGGVDIKPLAKDAKAYLQLLDMINKTSDRGPRSIGARYAATASSIDIYTVTIPAERKAWDAETRGKSNVKTLFHGTANANVRHILKTGLTIPANAANGRRCGDGIYFADRYARSYAYSSGGKHPVKMMFVADVALGKMYKTSGTYSGRQAPAGYDSVHGTSTFSGQGDEFVVFNRSQQTLRAIVVINDRR